MGDYINGQSHHWFKASFIKHYYLCITFGIINYYDYTALVSLEKYCALAMAAI